MLGASERKDVMKKILILGGGKMGSFVARKMVYSYDITMLDKKYACTTRDRGITCVPCDLSKPEDIKFAMFDLVINCLPGAIAQKSVEATLKAGVNCVDISFYDSDPFLFDGLARDSGCTYVPDAGFAPGLTNLFVGRELAEHGTIDSVSLQAGGVSMSPLEPYGYSLTWCAEDLLEDYIRPARWIHNHKIQDGKPFYNHGPAYIRGVPMWQFASDGLRTLLRYKDHVRNMEECTVRWNEQHMWDMMKLVDKNKFVEELTEKCAGVRDSVVFQADFYKADVYRKLITMVYHKSYEWSAMAHVTGMACVATAEAILQEVYQKTGVKPLEELGKDEFTLNFILDILAANGVQFEHDETNP
jgi:saccharopine dehydrogenase-like NADP-dependent oxidoreductase